VLLWAPASLSAAPAPRLAVDTLPHTTAATDSLEDGAAQRPSLNRHSCKSVSYVAMPGGEAASSPAKPRPAPPAPHIPLLKIHGNVLYELSYRSFIDTPYSDHEVYQHLVQAYLDVTYKNNYPFRIYLTNRWSNTPLLRNYFDLGLQYNRNDFVGNVRRQALQLLAKRFSMDSLNALRQQLEAKEKELTQLRHMTDSLSAAERIVGAKEDKWLADQHNSTTVPQLPAWPGSKTLYGMGSKRLSGNSAADSTKAPSTLKNLNNNYDSLKTRLDSLETQAGRLLKHYEQEKAGWEARYTQAQQGLNNIRDGKTLADTLHRLGISDSSLPKGYQALMAVRSLGIGRSTLNYSELSAKNVSINGMELEYNPHSYYAVAIGTVDYRFRDYVVTPPASGQYLAVVRYGQGKLDGNHIIGTWYTGKRQLYNAYTNPQTGTIPNYQLMGFTIESRYQLTPNTYVMGEIAKSSLPYYSLDSSQGHHVLGTALNGSDRTNEAWSVEMNSFLPATQTRLSGSWQRFGANFQSFSLFTTGAAHTSWKLMADQPFFKKQLLVRAGIRTNDYSNPLLGAAYQSSALFGTLQATLRMKGWPVLQVGYFPSSQLLKTADNTYEENLFFTLSASASHTYRVGQLQMMSLLLYTRFYNQQRDSSLVYYNTRNWQVSQTLFLNRVTCQLQGSAALASTYNLYMMEGRLDVKCNRWLSVGGGLKYNDQTVYNILQWGYSGTVTLRLARLGELQGMADKGFIPGSNQQLVPSNIGRLSYFKTF
jgi:hypothetical protein